jgi:hypothetical protein
MVEELQESGQMSLKEIAQIVTIFFSVVGAVYFVSGRMATLENTQNDQGTQITQQGLDLRALQQQGWTNNSAIAQLQQNVADLRAAIPHGNP